jgi:hypothetical protein
MFILTKAVKPGKDLQYKIIAMHVIIGTYIVLFYGKMQQTYFSAEESNFQKDIKYSQFSGEMVICLFIHLLISFFDNMFQLIIHPLSFG